MPFAGFVIELQKKKMLPPSWSVIGAQVRNMNFIETKRITGYLVLSQINSGSSHFLLNIYDFIFRTLTIHLVKL